MRSFAACMRSSSRLMPALRDIILVLPPIELPLLAPGEVPPPKRLKTLAVSPPPFGGLVDDVAPAPPPNWLPPLIPGLPLPIPPPKPGLLDWLPRPGLLAWLPMPPPMPPPMPGVFAIPGDLAPAPKGEGPPPSAVPLEDEAGEPGEEPKLEFTPRPPGVVPPRPPGLFI